MGIGLRAAARELGIQHSALKKAADNGRVPRQPDGTFDVDACRAAMAQNTNPARQRSARMQQRGAAPAPAAAPAPPAKHRRAERKAEPPDDDGSDGSYSEALRQREWCEVEKRRLALDRERGRTVELAPINAYVAGLIIQARDEFLRIGPELRDMLAQEADPIACEEMVVTRIVDALGKMAEYKPETE